MGRTARRFLRDRDHKSEMGYPAEPSARLRGDLSRLALRLTARGAPGEAPGPETLGRWRIPVRRGIFGIRQRPSVWDVRSIRTAQRA